MKNGRYVIESSIAKAIAICLIPGIIMGTILMGSPLIAFINIPSFLIVIILLGSGIAFSFGLALPFKAFFHAFLMGAPLKKTELNLCIKLFDYATSLSFGAGIIGSLISFIQIFIVAEEWKIVDGRTSVALLPIFYGCLIAYLIIKPLKYSFINNQMRNKSER